MLGIPRRYSHFVFGFIQSADLRDRSRDRQCATGVVRPFRSALAASLAALLASDVASRAVRGADNPALDACGDD